MAKLVLIYPYGRSCGRPKTDLVWDVGRERRFEQVGMQVDHITRVELFPVCTG